MNFDFYIKLVLDNTALLGVIFLIGGLIKVYTYYKLFGVFIFEFIDLKEVLTLFLSNLFSFFFFLAVVVILIILDIYVIKTAFIFICVMLTLISFIVLKLRSKIYLYEILIQNAILWTVYIIIINDLFENIVKYLSSSNDKYFMFYLFIFLIIFSIANACNEYYKVKYRNFYLNTTIIFSNEIMVPTVGKYYIGKTEKFIFIYNSIDKTTEVFQVSEVKKILIKT